MAVFKHWLDEVTDGDHEAVYRVMRSKHPGYSPDPEQAWTNLRKTLDEFK